jgi:[ribosomal protein S18]-alanine N-acetyltransferase
VNAFSITPYHRRHRQSILDLMFRSYLVHTHLDWNDTEDWLEKEDAVSLLLWEHGKLLAVMAASKPLNGTSWLRLVLLEAEYVAHEALAYLWDSLKIQLRELGVTTAALLITRDWIARYVTEMGFQYIEDIITMRRSGHHLPPRPETSCLIRSAQHEDLAAIALVDHAAFASPWQMSIHELQQAKIVSASCTVALLNEEIIGYQLSTLYGDGAHLARLAVLPVIQGHGVGSLLLDDVLHRFLRRGIHQMTVNTQASNHRSQRLYTRYGFRPNGYDLPVWIATL